MDPEIIRYKLQTYFDGESNLEDERLLHDYFRSETIDRELLPYRNFFAGLGELKACGTGIQDEDLMDFILEHEQREKVRYRKFWQLVTGVAAMLLIALLAVHYSGNRQNWNDTYTDPDQAYAVAIHTLQFMAGKYQEGMAQLEPVGRLKQAVRPMNRSISLINKGFEEMKNIEKVKAEPNK